MDARGLEWQVLAWVATLLLLLLGCARRFNYWKYVPRLKTGDAPLPLGSMGWPIIGESLQFLTIDPDKLYHRKLGKYGKTYMTHMLGSPTIVTTTLESAREVLISKQAVFEASYPDSMKRIIGDKGLMFLTGSHHARVRRLIQAPLLPEALRTVVDRMEALALLTLQNWNGRTLVVYDEASKFAFNAISNLLFGVWPSPETERLWKEFAKLDRAILHIPLDIPGTPFHAGLQARKRIIGILEKMISERRAGADHQHDVLNAMLNTEGELGRITDEEIQDNILTALFAGQDTSAVAILWAIYHLSENPDVLADLRAEHEEILRSKSNPNDPLTWGDIKNMKLCHWILYESVRLNVASYLFRKAETDTVIDGYTIPKGWKVQAYTRFFHTDAAYYSDPLKFNPYRYKTEPKALAFMIFGAGTHTCPGSEFAKLELAVFLHHFVTKYTWEVKPNPKRHRVLIPVPHLSDGLPVFMKQRLPPT